MPLAALKKLAALPPMDRVRAYIVVWFSGLVGIALLVSLGSMVYFKVKAPDADIGIWLNVFLTCLGYVVGILTGLLGIPAVTSNQPPTQSSQ
jgi:uncharacterized membrane protein YfcA